MKRIVQCLSLVLFALLLLPTAGFAVEGVPSPDNHLVLPADQFWPLVIGAFVPAVTYVLNKYGAWTTEPVKSLVTALASTIAACAYQLLVSGEIAFDTETIQVVVTSLIGTFGAHAGFWKPSGLSTKLGGGQNAQDDPRR